MKRVSGRTALAGRRVVVFGVFCVDVSGFVVVVSTVVTKGVVVVVVAVVVVFSVVVVDLGSRLALSVSRVSPVLIAEATGNLDTKKGRAIFRRFWAFSKNEKKHLFYYILYP